MILYAQAAVGGLMLTETVIGNIALTLATLQLVSKAVTAVSNKEFEAEHKSRRAFLWQKICSALG